jgi:V8-like Glu-specific endopeptidase
MKSPKILILIAATVLSSLGVACDTTEGEAPALHNAATRESQAQLVADMKPLETRMRLRRKLGPILTAEEAGLPIAQEADLLETDAGREWLTAKAEIEKNLAGSDWSKEPREGVERVIFVDGENEWEIEYEGADLVAQYEEARRRGVNEASDGDFDDEEAYATPRAWSNGIDSRIVKPINVTYPLNHRVLGRIAELNGGGCSGQMIGRRLVLTAAHCVVPASGAPVMQTVRVRRSGNQEPYGAVQTNTYWWASQWTSNNCHTNRRFDPCTPHDWALLLLPDDAWDTSPNGTPGWMGYWVPGEAYIRDNAVSNNDGYPAPWGASAPAASAANPNQVWGQTFSGTARGFSYYYDGVPAYYRISNDISAGHSGSGNWSDYPGQNGPYTLGIAMWEHCFTDCDDLAGDFATHPSGFRGMTHWLAGFITDQRVAYP